MKSKIFLTLVFIMFSALALTARADYTVENNKMLDDNVADVFFDFGTINITAWGDLVNYIDKKLKDDPAAQSNRNYSHRLTMPTYRGEYATQLIIETDPMPAYIANNYYKNITNLNDRNYTIFKVDNTNNHLGFIMTVSDGTNANSPVQLVKGKNIIFPLSASDHRVTIKPTTSTSLTYNAETEWRIDAEVFVSLVLIPANDMQLGSFTFNKKVGTLIVYRTRIFPRQGQIYKRNLFIRGTLNISVPSCTIGNKSINLGTVSRNEILAGNLAEKSTDLSLSCPTGIAHIYARAYDVNDTNNRNAFGRLSLKCASGAEASGVKIEVKVNDTLAKFGERSFVRPINLTTGKEYTDFLARDPTLLDLGNNAGTKTIKVSGKYIQEGAATITPGCANGKMGIIFNYK